MIGVEAIHETTRLTRKAVKIARSGGAVALTQAAHRFLARRCRSWLDTRFDRRYGVDTGGLHDDVATLGASGPHLADANGYEAVQFGVFRTILRTAAIDTSRYVFVDYGCGKGRALLLAAECGFESVVGVELAPALHTVAVRNVEAYRRRCPGSPRIDVCLGDAADLPLPPNNALLFFYNPFREAVCRKVLTNIERAYRQRPRNLVVAYRNPVHAQVFDETEFLRPVVRNRIFNLYRSGGPEELVPAAPV